MKSRDKHTVMCDTEAIVTLLVAAIVRLSVDTSASLNGLQISDDALQDPGLARVTELSICLRVYGTRSQQYIRGTLCMYSEQSHLSYVSAVPFFSLKPVLVTTCTAQCNIAQTPNHPAVWSSWLWQRTHRSASGWTGRESNYTTIASP